MCTDVEYHISSFAVEDIMALIIFVMLRMVLLFGVGAHFFIKSDVLWLGSMHCSHSGSLHHCAQPESCRFFCMSVRLVVELRSNRGIGWCFLLCFLWVLIVVPLTH